MWVEFSPLCCFRWTSPQVANFIKRFEEVFVKFRFKLTKTQDLTKAKLQTGKKDRLFYNDSTSYIVRRIFPASRHFGS